jgi:hypothetical protein
MNRTLVQTVALVFGIVYLAVGVLAFLPFLGGTFGQTPHSFLGFIEINLLHNIVHLVIGIAGIAAASDRVRSRMFCQVAGVFLLVIGVLGIFVHNPLGIIPIGGFDVAIHLLTGGLLAYFGFAAPQEIRRAAA